MTWPEVTFIAAVALIGIPAAILRNRTALALVLSWCVQEAIWLLTGETGDALTGLVLDYGVILAILSKPEPRDCSPYPTLRHQVAAFWRERSRPDAAILATFPVMWLVHAMRLDAFHQWWALWWLALGQIALAGAEAFGPPLRRLSVAFLRFREKPPPDAMRVVAVHA